MGRSGLAKSGLDCRIGRAGQLPARHGSLDRLPDPLRGGFHVPVADMGVAQRHFRVGVPEHPCDRRQRDAPGHRLACDRVSQVVQADDFQAHLASTLGNITDDDVARPIVVYCVDANCWLSYNAALRLHALGYENLYWYRGGIAAWNAANLPTRMANR